MAELRDSILRINTLEAHVRGFEFEKFLGSLFEAHGLAPRSSFRLVGEQIDGSFVFGSDVYLVEAKWQTKLTSQDDLLIFREKVESKSAWTRGLFVSYSGFSEDGITAFARGRATNIIGMTGQDLHFILSGKCHSLIQLLAKLDVQQKRASSSSPFLIYCARSWFRSPMATQFNTDLLERFVAPGITSFDQAEIPDLRQVHDQHPYWLANHFLESILATAYQGFYRQYVFNSLYRIQTAFSSYHEARDLTGKYLSITILDNPAIGAYFQALARWETCFLNWQILVEIFNKMSKEHLFQADDGSAEQRHTAYPMQSNTLASLLQEEITTMAH